jgi:hypothetical protein
MNPTSAMSTREMGAAGGDLYVTANTQVTVTAQDTSTTTAQGEGLAAKIKKKRPKASKLDELFSAPVLCQPIKVRNLPASFFAESSLGRPSDLQQEQFDMQRGEFRHSNPNLSFFFRAISSFRVRSCPSLVFVPLSSQQRRWRALLLDVGGGVWARD